MSTNSIDPAVLRDLALQATALEHNLRRQAEIEGGGQWQRDYHQSAENLHLLAYMLTERAHDIETTLHWEIPK